jgi:hypothetical protein
MTTSTSTSIRPRCRRRVAGGDHLRARQLLRPVAFAGATEEGVRTDLTDRTGRPLVYLTFGTVFNDSEAFRAALAGIREVGMGLVVTVGPNGDPRAFGPEPARVVVERYIPQTQLLPVCDVVASHAGSGTVLGALVLGIPASRSAQKRRTAASQLASPDRVRIAEVGVPGAGPQ